MPVEKRSKMNEIGRVGGMIIAVLLTAAAAGWLSAQQSISPQMTRLEELLAHLPNTQTPATTTVQIVPLLPTPEPEQNRLPSLFRNGRVSPALRLVRRSTAEGFVTKEQQLGFAIALTSDGWFVVPATALANLHVADLSVEWGGRTLPVLGGLKDSFSDLAYLKVQGTDLPTAALLNAQEVTAGQSVWLEEARDRYLPETLTALQAEEMSEAQSSDKLVRRYRISIAAASTSAVWDSQGRLLGIVEGAAGGVGQRVMPAFAIQSALSSILSNGDVRRASLGVQFIELGDVTEQATNRKLPLHGALLMANRRETKAAVSASGPASKFLKDGDVIERIERDILDGSATLSEHIAEYRPGAMVTIAGQRQGQSFTVSVPLGSVVTSDVLK